MRATDLDRFPDHRHDDTSSTARPARAAMCKAVAVPAAGFDHELQISSSGMGFANAMNTGLCPLIQLDGAGGIAGADTLVVRAADSSGHALPDRLRSRFEASLGTDLGGVRVRTDGAAAVASSALGAHAYATGQDVVMGAGEYAPDMAEGVHLLAYEVAHTVQQRGASAAPGMKLEFSEPGDAMKDAADAMVAGATTLDRAGRATHPALRRRTP